MKILKTAIAGSALVLGLATSANAAITYDTWSTNEGISGNYILTIDDLTGGTFSFNLTVNPWNAEALGLFVDLGDKDVGSPGLANIVPAGEVSIFATDTTLDDCGAGCSLNGLAANPITPDDEWELVFRLGEQGFDSIQTFSWEVTGLPTSGVDAITLSDFGLVGIRAQQLCDSGSLLPDGACGGSDKSYGEVPIPAAAWLFGSGLIGLAGIARKRKAA